jgi:hypothetical protein
LDKCLSDRYPKWFKEGGRKTYYIKKEIDEIDKYWNDLLYNVCKGNAQEMMQLKKFDILEFFDYVNKKREE